MLRQTIEDLQHAFLHLTHSNFLFMKRVQLQLLPLCLMVCVFALHAQSPVPASFNFEVNNVKSVSLTNGSLFTDGSSGQFIPVEPGLAELSLLRSAGLWIAGKTPSGQYIGTVQTSTQTDLIPGLPSLDDPFKLNDYWELTCEDVKQQVDDYRDNGVIDNPNAKVFGWPGLGNAYFSDYNPTQSLPLTENALCGYTDLGPTFGIYNPEEGDQPSIEIRGCPLAPTAPDKLGWFVFNDLQASHSSALLPIGLEFQTQIFGYASSANAANKTIYVRYKIINRATAPIQDCYFGAFADFSVGNPGDDFAGCDLEKYMLFAYNGDAVDEGGFGANAPAVGLDILRGAWGESNGDLIYLPLSKVMILNNVDNLQPEGFHRILSGKFPDGTPALNDGVMFEGNPNDPASNAEINSGSVPGKRLGVASFGPMNLEPGAVQEFMVAYSYAYTPGFTPAQNVQTLLDNSGDVQNLFDGCFLNSNNACTSLIPTQEPANNHTLRIFPNPATSSLTVENETERFQSVEFFNVLGQMVHQVSLESAVNTATIPLENVQAGVYQLRVGGQTQTVVVQR